MWKKYPLLQVAFTCFILITGIHAQLIDKPHLPNGRQEPKEHTWAVQLLHKQTKQPFTETEAETFAQQKGLLSLGPVGGLEGHYLFKLDNLKLSKKSHIVDGEDGSVSTHTIDKRHPKVVVEEDLLDAEHVHWFEYQELKKRTRRAATVRVVEDEADLGFNMFLDPLYQSQWHLVSLFVLNWAYNTSQVTDSIQTKRGTMVKMQLLKETIYMLSQ